MNPLRHTALASILSLLAAAGCSAMRSGAPSATAYHGGYAPARGPAVSATSVAYAPPPSGDAPTTIARAEAAPAPQSVAAATGAPPPSTVPGASTTPAANGASIAADDEAAAVPQGGVLTAATVGDCDRRENYQSYLDRHTDERRALGTDLDLTRRVRVRVVDADGHPVNAAELTVNGDGFSLRARTHADGVWDFFPGVVAPRASGDATLQVLANQQSVASQRVRIPQRGDGADVTVRLAQHTAPAPRVLDLGFAIDVTGSMGDELRYVNAELSAIVQHVQRRVPGVTVRVGATFYRDRSDSERVRRMAFTTDVAGFARAMRGVEAGGGGDYPEDMNAGLEDALTGLQWSTTADAVRVLVVVADAPPQAYDDEQFTWREAMASASQRGIRLLPVAASGADRTVEYLFRAMGAVTSTPYAYLTDDSGVGAPHMEADTDRVAVERFADMLERLVISDLQGHGMHEPGDLGRPDGERAQVAAR